MERPRHRGDPAPRSPQGRNARADARTLPIGTGSGTSSRGAARDRRYDDEAPAAGARTYRSLSASSSTTAVPARASRLLDDHRRGRGAHATGDVDGCGGEEELVDAVGRAVVGQCIEVEELSERH